MISKRKEHSTGWEIKVFVWESNVEYWFPYKNYCSEENMNSKLKLHTQRINWRNLR